MNLSKIVSGWARTDTGWSIAPEGMKWITCGTHIRVGKKVKMEEGAVIESNVTIKSRVKIHESARLGANTCVGKNAVIGARTIIQAGTKIGADTEVGADCTFGVNTILKRRVVIGDGSMIRSDIGNDVTVGKKCEITATSIGRSTIIGNSVTIGQDTEVQANVSIAAGAKIGADNEIGLGAMIGQNASTGTGVILADRIRIGNEVYVPDGVTIGTGADIGHEVRLCQSNAIIGAYACVPNTASYVQSIGSVGLLPITLFLLDDVAHVSVARSCWQITRAIESTLGDWPKGIFAGADPTTTLNQIRAFLCAASMLSTMNGWFLSSDARDNYNRALEAEREEAASTEAATALATSSTAQKEQS